MYVEFVNLFNVGLSEVSMLENSTVSLWKPWGTMPFCTILSRGDYNWVSIALCVITVELTALY